MQARAAAGAAAEAAKAKEKDEVRELMKTFCWRAAILIICILAAALTCSVAVARREGRLHFIWALVGGEHEGAMVRTMAAVPDKFFIEIGTSPKTLESSVGGKHLENLGWSGVCVIPFPVTLTGRACKTVALPIGAKDGMVVQVPDCARNTHGVQGVMNMIFRKACEEVPATTVSIGKLLGIADAPKVIDYISLDNQDYLNPEHSQLDIIKNFPFDEHCARAWAIHVYDLNIMSNITNQLEVSQGCSVHTTGSQIFARCPCAKFDSAEPETPAMRTRPAPANVSEIAILPSGQGEHRQARDVSPHVSATVTIAAAA